MRNLSLSAFNRNSLQMCDFAKLLGITLILSLTASNVSAQTLDWAKTIGSPTFPGSYGHDIAVDNSGNVFVTGFFRNTVDFDPGPGTATITAQGGGGNPQDFFLAKYNSNGSYLWAFSLGNTNDEFGRSLATDASGNVYVTGVYTQTVDFDPGAGTANLSSNVGYGALFFAKYDANGNYQWVKSISASGSGGQNHMAWEIKLDGSNNVYLVGTFRGAVDFDPGSNTAILTSTMSDIFFAKYDNSGNHVWAKQIGGSTDDQGFSIDIDGSGNVYIAGWFTGVADFDPGLGTATLVTAGSVSHDGFFAKYTSNGTYQWAKSIGSFTADVVKSIEVDASGNVYISGGFMSTVDFDPGVGTTTLTSIGHFDIYLAKYDNSGNFIWVKTIGNTGYDLPWEMELDAGSNTYLTGRFAGTVDFDPGPGMINLSAIAPIASFLTKLDPSGNTIWASAIVPSNSNVQNGNESIGMALDPNCGLHITGWFQNNADFDTGPATVTLATTNPTNNQVFFAKYSGCNCSVNLSSSSNPICLGSSVTLSTNATASISWNTGATTPSIIVTPSATTSYTVSGSATSGTTTCTGTQVIQVNVNPLPTVTAVSEKTQVCVNTSVSFSATGASSYLWNNNANTDTTSAFISTAGLHSMVVTGTDQNGCKNTATVTITAQICSDLPQHDLHGVTVFPNPGHGLYTLRLHENAAYTVKIFTCAGSLITEMVAETNEIPIDLRNNDSGIYFLQVYSRGKPSIALQIIKE